MFPSTPLISFCECATQEQVLKVDALIKRCEQAKTLDDALLKQVILAQALLKKGFDEHYAKYARNMAEMRKMHPIGLQTSTWTVGDLQTLRQPPKKKKRKNNTLVAAKGGVASASGGAGGTGDKEDKPKKGKKIKKE